MENWDDYRFILALSRQGTVRSAATQLGVTHSTVSRRLAVINDKYGAPLFDRIAGGYKPTELGEQLLDAAKRVEQINFSVRRKQRVIGADLSGPITLSIPGVLGHFLLLEELAKFSQEYPEIQLTIHSSYQFADLDKSEADIVVRAVAKPPEHFVGRRLFPYALGYYCRRDYLGKTALDDLSWIVDPATVNPEQWIAASPFPDAPIGLRIDDILLRHSAAVMGQGLARGACYIADQEPMLMRLPGTEIFEGPDFWVLTHPDLKNSPRIKLLMRFIASSMMASRDLIEGQTPYK